jgi:hypothetical protein
MSFVLAREQNSVEVAGSSTTVPNDPISKLMYYLNCVDSVISDIANFPKCAINYQNARNVSVEQFAGIVQFILRFEPKFMIEHLYFIPTQEKTVLGYRNQFLKSQTKEI